MAPLLDVETTRAPATARASSAAGWPAYQAYLILYAGFVALRDFGLSLGALALARLSQYFKYPMAGSIAHGSSPNRTTSCL